MTEQEIVDIVNRVVGSSPSEADGDGWYAWRRSWHTPRNATRACELACEHAMKWQREIMEAMPGGVSEKARTPKGLRYMFMTPADGAVYGIVRTKADVYDREWHTIVTLTVSTATGTGT